MPQIIDLIRDFEEYSSGLPAAQARSAFEHARRRHAFRVLLSLVPNQLGRWTGIHRHNPALIQQSYDAFYKGGTQGLAAYLSKEAPQQFFRFGERYYKAGVYGAKRVHLIHVLEAIRNRNPASLLEVGSGSGLNLAAIAASTQKTTLCGVEFTSEGVRTANELGRGNLPEGFEQFAGIATVTEDMRDAMSRIRFVQADARHLPLPDKSFDMTLTVLALEQMYSIYRQALMEIRRVTRSTAMFIEPFREANDFFGRIHLIRANYFRASYREFSKFGFIPESFSVEVPQKITFRPGILICRVTS